MTYLNSILIFIYVVENGSFSAAAKKLKMPVSSVSRKISELETKLEVRLIERSTRNLRLTDQGAGYYNRCKQAVRELVDARTFVHESSNEIKGELKLSIPPGLEREIIIPLIQDFQNIHSSVKVAISICDSYQNMFDNNFDFAFRVGPMEDSTLIAKTLVEYEHILVASPTYISAFGMPSSPEDLSQHKLINFNSQNHIPIWYFKKAETTVEHKVKSTLSINDHNSKQYAAELSMGITDIPSITSRNLFHKRKLIQVLPEWKLNIFNSHSITLSLVYPSRTHMSKLNRIFVEYSSHFFKNNVDTQG